MTVLADRHTASLTWTRACPMHRLLPGRGVAVLLPGGAQAALFLLPGQKLVAVGNIDPFGRAAVMSRGITGDRRGEPTVASPLGKQVFSLVDGRCLDNGPGAGGTSRSPGRAKRPGEINDDEKALPVYDVRVVDGFVEIACT